MALEGKVGSGHGPSAQSQVEQRARRAAGRSQPHDPLPTDGGGARSRAAGGEGVAVRAEVGRVPRSARKRQRRPSALVAKRAAAAPLFPRARVAREAPAAEVRARRRDRDRAQGRARLRRHADAPAPGREPRAQAVSRDPGALHRFRRSRLEGRAGVEGAAREAPDEARASRQALRALSRHARSGRGGGVARAVRGDRPRRSRRQAPRPAVSPRAHATAS